MFEIKDERIKALMERRKKFADFVKKLEDKIQKNSNPSKSKSFYIFGPRLSAVEIASLDLYLNTAENTSFYNTWFPNIYHVFCWKDEEAI